MLSISTGQAPGLRRGDGACPEGPEGRVDDAGGAGGAVAGEAGDAGDAGDGGGPLGDAAPKLVWSLVN